MARTSPRTAPSLDAIVELSRALADLEDPARIPELVVDVAHRTLRPSVVALYTTGDTGLPTLAAVRGAAPEALAAPDWLDSDLASVALAGLDGLASETHLLTAAGGLFGALVLGYPIDREREEDGGLAPAIADLAATALDRAFRTRELLDTIRALESSREELARTESLRRLGQMAAVVAHEVKNPLASIGGVLQVLRNRFPSPSGEREIVGKVLDRLTELNRMVDELLQFARPRTPARVPVRAATLLTEVVGLFHQDPGAGAVTVRQHVEDAEVNVDPGMLQRVLLNLLLNAAQAMDGRGVVTLSCAPGPDGVEIGVTDEGPGVPPDAVERIFEPFFTTKARGSGLGLAIARQVVEAHGGAINYRAATPNGADFRVSLPRA